MKRFTLLFLAVCSFLMFIFSCMSDEEYAKSVISEGFVNYKNSNTNIDNFFQLCYANFYKIDNDSLGDYYVIKLSQKYISPESTMTDTYIYCEIYNPKSQSVSGDYQLKNFPYRHPIHKRLEKSVNFFAYYDTDVCLTQGSPISFKGVHNRFLFSSGVLSIKQLTEDKYRFYISFGDGKMKLTAFFNGYLNYK